LVCCSAAGPSDSRRARSRWAAAVSSEVWLMRRSMRYSSGADVPGVPLSSCRAET
jgi:hypothetical protein